MIAAYLASYNPARLDVRFFSKASEDYRKKKGGGAVKGRVSKKVVTRQQLLGPMSFPVERMLAIFYSVIDPTEAKLDIQIQVNMIIH